MVNETPPTRSLSRREAKLVGWLEADRRPTISVAEVRRAMGWSPVVTRNALYRLVGKGWLSRTANGQYEVLLAETGGWAVPNPWAALSTWGQRYYVGFKSAAYEQKLTPDRPGSVQICVPVGAKRPLAWHEIPIELIYLQKFATEGSEIRDVHGFPVRVASVEKTLVDSAGTPARIGGILGLARVVDRSSERADWTRVVALASLAPRGRVALRRLAAILDLFDRSIPQPLATAAAARPGESPFFLGERRAYGAKGDRLSHWQVVVNIDPALIFEELVR